MMDNEIHEYIRDEEDVRITLDLAKINQPEIKNVTQVLYSKLNKKDPNLKLLELDNCLLSALQEGQRLHFKGDPEESLVLTTDSRTYEIREAENSNTLMVYPNLKFSKDLPDCQSHKIEKVDCKGIFHTYFEATSCRPKLDKLMTLLEPTSFKGIEYEKQLDKTELYDWDRLFSVVQASEKEIKDAFDEYLIAEIDGYYRLVEFSYEKKCLTLMLDFVEENSWNNDELNRDEMMVGLNELMPPEVFDVVFRKYTIQNKNNELYSYNVDAVCRSFVQILLSAAPVINEGAFAEAWEMAVPDENMKFKKEYLHGIAVIVDHDAKDPDIVALPESRLPNNVIDRFNELFKCKPKWTLQEITPYISKLVENDANVNFLLTKHARSSVKNGVRYYCSKYSK